MQYHATNDKDKLYGILSLAVNADRMVPRPDYSQSTLQIYCKLVASTIKERGNLDVLSLVAGMPSPSFMPCFSVRTIKGMNPALTDQSFSLMDFQASKDYLPDFQLSDFLTFTSKGVHIDTIDSLGASHWDLEGHGVAQQGDSRHSIYDHDTGSFDAIWRSLLAGPARIFGEFSWHSTSELVFRALFAENCAPLKSMTRNFLITLHDFSDFNTLESF
jgi:hypothetical protein